MTEKTFTVAGTSFYKEEYKVRFANALSRAKVLVKNDHTDVRLVELPNEMTKFEAVMYIKGHEDFQDTAAQTAIADYIGEQTEVVDLTAKKVKAPKEVKSTAEKKLSKKDELMKRELEALAEARAVAAMDAALAEEGCVEEDEDAPY